LDPHGVVPVVGVEPSEIYTLIDELPDLLPEDDYGVSLAERAWMVDEFLLRREQGGKPRLEKLNFNPNARENVLLHGHCYQKARPPAPDGLPVGVRATRTALEYAGYRVEEIDSGCCGMAGAFGYEEEHYAVSMRVAELKLLPAVLAAVEGSLIAAAGVSCQSQIADGTRREALHPARLLIRALNN
jgi:Fe-S oxidoreductase